MSSSGKKRLIDDADDVVFTPDNSLSLKEAKVVNSIFFGLTDQVYYFSDIGQHSF